MKNPFKKLAALCVTAYANRTFRKAVELAEQKRRTSCAKQYVISDPFPQNAERLIVVSAKEFQDMKHFFKVPVGAIPGDVLINQSWYYTRGVNGRGRMDREQVEIRRLAFVGMLLHRAKLA